MHYVADELLRRSSSTLPEARSKQDCKIQDIEEVCATELLVAPKIDFAIELSQSFGTFLMQILLNFFPGL